MTIRKIHPAAFLDVCFAGGRLITERELDMRRGTEGPKHDPYAFSEYIVKQNGIRYVAHLGLAEWMKVVYPRDDEHPRGHEVKVAEFEHVERAFEYLTGIALRRFEEYYERVHPYFEDPMGHPSMYE